MVDLAMLLSILLQGAIFALVVVAVRRWSVAAVINTLAAFVLALLPSVVEVLSQVMPGRGVSFGVVLPVWLAAAGLLHSLGMLGLYESTWWWDHLTHTVSAALVAAVLYAAVIVTGPAVAGIGPAPERVWVVTVVFTLAIGVFWELIELAARDVGERFDIEPVLVYYGVRDTAFDLGFDVVGALLVVGVDLRVFVPIVERFPDVTRVVLFGTGWVILVGSLVMTLFVWAGGSRSSA